MNKPNAEGLVPVYLLQAFGKNFPKTVAGFPEDLAKTLVAKNLATYDLTGKGAAPAAEASEPPRAAKASREPKAAAEKKPAGPVEIPANWPEIHYLQQIKLAKQIAGPDQKEPMTKDLAIKILTAEVARRANPEGVN